MKNTPTIGAVSSGTMRLEDLIPTFIAEIEYLTGESLAHETEEHEARDYDEMTDEEDWAAGCQLEALFDRLSDLAPAYCFFGSHEGEGACYGFWPSMESVRDDIRSGDLLDCSEEGGPPDYTDDGYDGYVVITDHGNVTLYDADGGVIWECV